MKFSSDANTAIFAVYETVLNIVIDTDSKRILIILWRTKVPRGYGTGLILIKLEPIIAENTVPVGMDSFAIHRDLYIFTVEEQLIFFWLDAGNAVRIALKISTVLHGFETTVVFRGKSRGTSYAESRYAHKNAFWANSRLVRLFDVWIFETTKLSVLVNHTVWNDSVFANTGCDHNRKKIWKGIDELVAWVALYTTLNAYGII